MVSSRVFLTCLPIANDVIIASVVHLPGSPRSRRCMDRQLYGRREFRIGVPVVLAPQPGAPWPKSVLLEPPAEYTLSSYGLEPRVPSNGHRMKLGSATYPRVLTTSTTSPSSALTLSLGVSF